MNYYSNFALYIGINVDLFFYFTLEVHSNHFVGKDLNG